MTPDPLLQSLQSLGLRMGRLQYIVRQLHEQAESTPSQDAVIVSRKQLDRLYALAFASKGA